MNVKCNGMRATVLLAAQLTVGGSAARFKHDKTLHVCKNTKRQGYFNIH